MNASTSSRLWLKTLCALLSAAAVGAGCQSAPLRFAKKTGLNESHIATANEPSSDESYVAQASHMRQLPEFEPLPMSGGPHLASPPHELAKTVLPQYVIEPPDILIIQSLNATMRTPTRLRSQYELGIEVTVTSADATPTAPTPGAPTSPTTPVISGTFPIQPGGVIQLPGRYGSVVVEGLTIQEAGRAIETKLKETFQRPIVNLWIESMPALPVLGDECVVGPDGTVNLGFYGTVQVVGMTVEEAKRAIEAHLEQYLDRPEVAVTVFTFNSKVFYVVFEGANLGDRVIKLPITGNETVLDALSDPNIQGLSDISSTRMWIARPAPDGVKPLILPIDWRHVTARGDSATNYQLLPGDRLFIAEDKFVAFDNGLAKLLAPIERMMGFTLLGQRTAANLSGKVLQNTGNQGGIGGF